MKSLVVSPEEAGKRLDVWLATQITEISRSGLQKLCEDQKVTVNGTVEKTNYKVKPEDKVQIDASLDIKQAIPKINLPIIYEDNDCLVIDKPAGVLTHSKSAFNPEATVATFIADKIALNNSDRAGIVHRLDRLTSGLIICAKTPEAQKWLQKQFSTRKVKKTYIAIVNGHLDPREAAIDIPIGRHPKKPQTFRADPNGRVAKTGYKVLENLGAYDKVQLTPETGRTHQLRVHLNHLSHPIVGDTLYGAKPAKRMYLHATRLELTLPNKQRMVFESPLPAEFEQLQ